MPERKTIVLGCGKMVQQVHFKSFAAYPETRLVAIIEPSEAARTSAAERLEALDLEPPAMFPDLDAFRSAGIGADVAFIATPHNAHCQGILDCLDLGLDVLVEKPMVLNEVEARSVIAKRDETGKTVVVGFQGGLSPEVQKAKAMIRDGTIGRLISVAGTVHQNWKELATGTWRMEPEISGGGFLFDTGSHLINTMVHVVESDVAALQGILDYCATSVEINASLSGRFASGVLFTISMSGDSYGCDGYIDLVGTKGIIRLGMWGHIFKKTEGNLRVPMVDLEPAAPETAWKTFNAILDGKTENTSPPEVGLRFAHFMDLLRKNCSVIP